jgi:hypothetical protein
MNVLSMLNTKYIIVNDAKQRPIVQQNPDARGNAWFVENIHFVNSNRDELDILDSMDLVSNVYIHKEFAKDLEGFDPVKSGSITLTSYAPDELVYSSSAPSDQLAVFSDIYYGPGKGWQAYIDGVKAPHIRADYALRAMKVPQGDHEIRFTFEPKSYKYGEIISLICSFLIILILLFGLYKWLTKAEPTSPVAIRDHDHGHKQPSGNKKLLRKKKK